MARISFILGEFHKDLVSRMLEEAKSTAIENELEVSSEHWVPGSYEVPLMLKRVFQNENVDAVVLLGIIEKGQTKHGLVMAQSVFPAVIQLQLEFNKPVGIGIIGPEVLPEQIEPRLLPHARSAVLAVKKML